MPERSRSSQLTIEVRRWSRRAFKVASDQVTDTEGLTTAASARSPGIDFDRHPRTSRHHGRQYHVTSFNASHASRRRFAIITGLQRDLPLVNHAGCQCAVWLHTMPV